LLALGFGLSMSAVAAEETSGPSDAEVAAVAAVLREHPELVVEALNAVSAKEEAAKQARIAQIVTERRAEIEYDPVDQVSGNPAGDITIVEFSDYQCPYCKAMVGPVHEFLQADTKVRFVLKEFPVLAPISMDAAKVALTSAQDGKYEAVHGALMARRAPLDEAALRQTALESGMSAVEIDAALKNDALGDSLKAHVELGKALGITGTPTFLIGDQRFVGVATTEQLKQAVAKAREMRQPS